MSSWRRSSPSDIDSTLGPLSPDRFEYSFRKGIEGTLAAAEGRYAEALALLRESGDTSRHRPWALPDLARVYESVGQPDSALAAYERYLGATSLYRTQLDRAVKYPSDNPTAPHNQRFRNKPLNALRSSERALNTLKI